LPLEQETPERALIKRRLFQQKGVDDGNQKGGGSPQPAQESQYFFITSAVVKQDMIDW